MKHILSTMLLASITSLSASANHPDSVYLKAFCPNPGEGVRVSYSVDQKTWIPIGNNYNLFKSDFGTWGAEKKMYTPALSYDGKTFYAEFIPNPNVPQIATTRSTDLYLWKPQDYPTLPDAQFAAKKKELEQKSQNNIIRVPYSVVENLITRAKAAELNAQQEREPMAIRGIDNISSVTSTLKVNLNDSKAISPDLFGIFFEDINYAADGGLYAELVQNRDFEYNKMDRGEWNAQTAWKLEGEGSTWSIASENPIHPNNSHYAVINTTTPGAKLTNAGYQGIPLKANNKYNLTAFVKGAGKVRVSLVSEGNVLASTTLSATKDWKPLKAVLSTKTDAKSAQLVIEPMQAGSLALDFISLMPQDTYKGHGLRKDLAQRLADIKPRFMRFPGGCMSHGDGINNIYHWQATVGEQWERQPDFNIWHYHQTRGLGFHEYFQFCEDMGAEPLPVLSAGVPCQNSRVGGHGQQGGIPFEKDLKGKPSPYIYNGKPLTMESYLQELLDLIEWANGDARTSKLAQIRAKAGHPKPFNLKYLGIGNEDLLGDTFNERFTFLFNGVKKAHPEITVVGTVGPFWEGSDYEFGWKEAKAQNIPIVDEHYYNPIGWYLNHQDFYDKYDRNGTKVYLGEWASKGNLLENALAEAIHITNVERNADVVVMSSYAPLLARNGHTQWNPDMIYFDNEGNYPTPNYYVQAISGQNAGDEYVYSTLTNAYDLKDKRNNPTHDADKRIKASVVTDKETGDIIIKLVNALTCPVSMNINLGYLTGYNTTAKMTHISGDLKDRNIAEPTSQDITVASEFTQQLPAASFSVIRIAKNQSKKKK